MPGPRIRAAKPGVDASTGSLVNMAFDSDYNLNKIARVIKKDSTGTAAHGLPYSPKILTMREPVSGRFGWFANTKVDPTNITATIGTHATSYSPYATAADVANWTYILIDPLSTGSYTKDMTGKACIKVGAGATTDYDYKLHSGYDTFKVAKTGTLTINAGAYDPGAGGGTSTLTATYDHNLGYAPMFAPFVNYETDIYFYHMANEAFDTSIINGGVWQASASYKLAEDVMDSGFNWYTCIKTHTSSAADEPGVGANWQTYWEVYEEPDNTNTYVNDIEDTKLNLWVFGDDGYHNYYYIKYYSTSTQLVLEYTRIVTPSDEPLYTYIPEPAGVVSVDYTIFYNEAGSEFNLL